MCLLHHPGVVQPRRDLGSSEGMGGMSPVLPDRQPGRSDPLRDVHHVHDEISRGKRLAALPDADRVVDEINADTRIARAIGLKQLHQPSTQRLKIRFERKLNDASVLGKTAPVTLKGEGDPVVHSHGAEDPPAVDYTGLTGRQACFCNRQNPAVVENKRVHVASLLRTGAAIVLNRTMNLPANPPGWRNWQTHGT